ncbi:histidinol-phosphate transaminase [Desulfococcaceae bacterium HSG8]|nr:histidinol-phosphate transaminase [Desulfococcaceae bacterium HSG8]
MFSERLKKLTPYVPGEQPRDRKYVKLNTNENPYSPSPKIREFLETCEIESLRLYPDPLATELRERIAEKYGVKKENVFAGNGSDEVLSFAFYAFFDNSNGNLLFPEFTYSFYPVYCDFYAIQYQKIPLRDDFSVDAEAYIGTESCGIIFPNPNAPTGICLSIEEIIRILENYPKDRAVIIDEAYIDFGGESAVRLINEYPNLLVIRTFSKSMSLAGLRLGFAIGDNGLIDALFTVKDSFNSYPLDMFAQKIGEIAIADEAYYSSVTKKIVETREELCSELGKAGWNFLSSKANFVFAGKKGIPGEDIYLGLRDRGILVRHFNIGKIKDFVRITVGTKDEMSRLIEEMKKL